MGESRDEYSGKRKAKGLLCSKTEERLCPVGAFFNDPG
jgi:hypothetical protein